MLMWFLMCVSPVVDLLGLLKWRSNTSLLQQNLRHLMKVDGGEVVKVRLNHLREIWIYFTVSQTAVLMACGNICAVNKTV